MLERDVLAMGTGCTFLTALSATFQTNEHLYFVIEFVVGGDLLFHLMKVTQFDEERVVFYTAELVLALEFLHYKGILHRDLKLENVMLTDKGHVKLTDFGVCTKEMHLPGATTNTFCGTPSYIAPEVIKYEPYGFPVDWWALGISVYYMLVGKTPFYARSQSLIFKRIESNNVTFPNKVVSEAAQSVIAGLLTKDPAERLGTTGTESMKEHAFFTSIDWQLLEQGQVTAPFIPDVKSAGDTSCFDEDFTSEANNVTQIKLNKEMKNRCENAFPGFTFTAK